MTMRILVDDKLFKGSLCYVKGGLWKVLHTTVEDILNDRDRSN